MSVVTTVLVCHDILEPPRVKTALRESLAALEAEWDAGEGPGFLWREYNHLDHTALWQRLNAIPWRRSDNVQVLVRREEDGRFQIWMYGGPTLTQLVHGNPD